MPLPHSVPSRLTSPRCRPGLGSVAESARHGRAVAKSLVERYRLLGPLVDRVEQAGRRLVDSPFVPFVRPRQRPTLLEYEQALEDAISRTASGRFEDGARASGPQRVQPRRVARRLPAPYGAVVRAR